MAGRTPEKERWKPPEMEDALHYFAEYAGCTPQRVVHLLDRLQSADVSELHSMESELELLSRRVRTRAKIVRLGLAAKYLELAESMTRRPTLSVQDVALSARMLAKDERGEGSEKRKDSGRALRSMRVAQPADGNGR